MPILHLRADVTEECGRFSVVGHYASRPFVKHAALLKADASLNFGMENVPVWHIGPPLVAGTKTSAAAGETDRTTTIHLAGFVDLDADDIEGIETWLAEVDKEDRPPRPLAQYRVSPPVHWIQAENGTPLYRQFSCVGFVLDGYRYIGVNLIDDSRPEHLPEVPLETVIAAYGPIASNEKIRERIGIPGPGPWRIVLAGYLFHSLNRDSDVIRRHPHVPTGIGEKDFPTSA